MHPPLIFLMRLVRGTSRTGSTSIPAGGLAMVSPAAAHRLPEVFADPDRYDPTGSRRPASRTAAPSTR